jgi:mevalonate kinase
MTQALYAYVNNKRKKKHSSIGTMFDNAISKMKKFCQFSKKDFQRTHYFSLSDNTIIVYTGCHGTTEQRPLLQPRSSWKILKGHNTYDDS